MGRSVDTISLSVELLTLLRTVNKNMKEHGKLSGVPHLHVVTSARIEGETASLL